jgi:hypothetical protein
MKKKVVTTIDNDDLVAINDTTDNENIYAFWSTNDNYAILIRNSDTGYYTNWMFADKMQEECYGPHNKLHDILQELLADGYDVFEFDSDLDFAEWVQENHSNL